VIAGTLAPSVGGSFAARNGGLAFSIEVDVDIDEVAFHTGLVLQSGHDRRFITRGYDPAFAPDGRTLALTAESGGIKLTDLNGRHIRRLTHGNDTAPTWSPSGERVAFARLDCESGCESEGIYTIGRNGGDPQVLVPNGLEPAWSRTGMIAFVVSRWPYWRGGSSIGEGGIYVVPGDGGEPRKIIARGDSPDWSPRGDRLTFTRSSGDHVGLFVANADGTAERRLRVTRNPLHSPKWSPDGRSIVYLERYRPYRISPDGTNRRRLPRFRCTPCAGRSHVVFGLAWRPLAPRRP
jgi:Tol biopolymer transport system component